jgi:predicted DNA-binding transcriptional regulator AlpA
LSSFHFDDDLPATVEEAILATDQKIPVRSFTISQWCEMRGYSRVHFYKMRKAGTAPQTYGAGKAQRISDDEDRRWLKRQERLARKAG